MDKPAAPTCPPEAQQPRPFRWVRLVLALTLLAGLGLFGWTYVRENFHEVVPGELYRSAQPNYERLARYQREHGIRTVVNLRGSWENDGWYQRESAACEELGLVRADINLRTHRLVPVHELRRLIEIYDTSERPLLLHCRQGSDRTALATALYLLLYEGATPDEARDAYTWEAGHNPWSYGYHLPHLFDLYEAWLGERKHSPDRFREWVANVQTLGYFGAALSFVSPPPTLAVGQAAHLRVRAENRSQYPWQLAAWSRAGIRLLVYIDPQTDDARRELYVAGPVGTVEPGETVEFDVTLPSDLAPGEYRLLADLEDAHGIIFHTMAVDWPGGMTPAQTNLVVGTSQLASDAENRNR